MPVDVSGEKSRQAKRLYDVRQSIPRMTSGCNSRHQKHDPNYGELDKIEPVPYRVRIVNEDIAVMCRQEENSDCELLRRGDQIE